MKTRIALFLLAAAGCTWAQTPAFTGNAVVNAASDTTPLAPGSLATIFGSNLASSMASADSIPLSTRLGGVTVQFVQGGTSYQAPMVYSSTGQLNVQVPWELVPGGAPVMVSVTSNSISSTAQQITVGPLGPGIFGSPVGSTTFAVAVNNSDNTLVWPAGTIAGSTTHPAKAGDVIVIYATGLGAVDTPIADGQAPFYSDNILRHTTTQPTVMIGGVPATFISSVLSPQFVGVYQVAVTVANNTPTGNVALQIVEGGQTTPNTTVIAISQ